MENEIDYSAVPPQPATTAPQQWRPPRHVYFGPKDLQTGQMQDEPAYVHVEWPRMMYRKDNGKVIARIVNSPVEFNALEQSGWEKTLEAVGIINAPSQEQILAAAGASIDVADVKRGPGRPKGS